MTDYLNKMLKEIHSRPFKRFSVSFSSDWDSFIFWKSMNWRNFTLITLYFETNSYSHWLEIDAAFLGIHFSFNIHRRFDEN